MAQSDAPHTIENSDIRHRTKNNRPQTNIRKEGTDTPTAQTGLDNKDPYLTAWDIEEVE